MLWLDQVDFSLQSSIEESEQKKEAEALLIKRVTIVHRGI